MFCQSCGAPNDPEARFCNQCGARIAAPGMPGGIVTQEPTMMGMGLEPSVDQTPRPVAMPPAPAASVWDPPAEPTLRSVTLTGIGIHSKGRAWSVIAIASLLLVGLGALGSFLAVSDAEPAATTVELYDPEQEQLDIGEPLPVGVAPPAEEAAPPPTPSPTDDEAARATPRPRPHRAQEQAADEPAPPNEPATAPEPEPEPPRAEADQMYRQRVYFVVGRYYGAAVQRCFEAARQGHPALEGQVTVRLQIGADGRVTEATSTANTTGDRALGGCLEGQARTWRLPAPPAGATTVEMPLRS